MKNMFGSLFFLLLAALLLKQFFSEGIDIFLQFFNLAFVLDEEDFFVSPILQVNFLQFVLVVLLLLCLLKFSHVVRMFHFFLQTLDIVTESIVLLLVFGLGYPKFVSL
jgi:hypothetical protein